MASACFASSLASASRVLLRSHRGCAGISSCRLSICKAQSRDAAPVTERDLVKGVQAPVIASLAAALTSPAAAWAEDVTEATAAAIDAAPAAPSANAFGSGEAILLLTPVFVYALFNVYRERLNPQAKFLDYIYIMAALAIFGNIFSILFFKTRFF